MDEANFQNRLKEIMGQIDTLPEGERERLHELAKETSARHEQIKESVAGMHESIDFLRMWIKYLLFDLEATRRENGTLRQMLEDNNSDS